MGRWSAFFAALMATLAACLAPVVVFALLYVLGEGGYVLEDAGLCTAAWPCESGPSRMLVDASRWMTGYYWLLAAALSIPVFLLSLAWTIRQLAVPGSRLRVTGFAMILIALPTALEFLTRSADFGGSPEVGEIFAWSFIGTAHTFVLATGTWLAFRRLPGNRPTPMRG